MKVLLFAALFSTLTACSLFDRNHENNEPPTRMEEAPQADASLAQNNVPPVTDVVDVSTSGPAVDAKAVSPVEATKLAGISPDVGLRYLKNGNTRFVKGTLRKDGQSKKDIQRVATSQKPHSLIFTTSDSRVPPEIIFDQKLGEIFVVRTVDMAFAGSAEDSVMYGVQELGIRNIIVLTYGDSGSNAVNLMNQMIQKSGFLAALQSNGEIRISGAVYDLQTGKVDFK